MRKTGPIRDSNRELVKLGLDYLDTVEFVIQTAFGIAVGELVTDSIEAVEAASDGSHTELPTDKTPNLRELTTDLDKILVAVAVTSPKAADDINAYFKREGEKLRLKAGAFTNVVARNSGSKRFFFYSREDKTWKLSSLGKYRLTELQGDPKDG